MAQNIMLVMAKAMAKGALNPNALTGLERFMLAQITIPDRVPTFLAATNVEPSLIDRNYDYQRLSQSAEANLELFTKVKERFSFDIVSVPTWLGLMLTGTAELGVQFQIEADRVPYACAHPLRGMEGVKAAKPFTQPSGYFKMTLDIYREAQRRFPDTMVTFMNDGPWDLAMLLRGDKQLPMDFRLHKDYAEAKDPQRRDKIRKYGDPDLWPAIMELTTRVSIQIFTLARQHGINMLGATVVDQFATKPVLGTEDFINYVLPYSQRVWLALDRKVGMGYFVASPQELEALLTHPILGTSLAATGFTNYIFPTTPDGVTLPEYDEPILALCRKHNRTYNYLVHAKFIRDATGQQLEDVVKRICGLATRTRTRMMVSVGAIAPGTDLQKIDALLNCIHTYGRYSR